ncbi:hypothetical protein M427DRAFT_55493, partial [Gonapodya prolifera JEL478]
HLGNVSNNKHVRLAVIGCGQRGRVYTRRCQENTSLGQVVAVADPAAERRQRIAHNRGLGTDLQFTSHADLFEAIDRTDLAVDAAIIGTLDSLHRDIVLEAAKRKLHILCEKPMATSIEAPERITTTGRVISVQHLEPIGWDHFAHSYFRGNWRREDETSFMLMTKSCQWSYAQLTHNNCSRHDMDILNYLFGGIKLNRVSSFGNLVHFRRDQKPEEVGSATRCLNSTTLREGPYGRCVYECENDVCDHQVANLEFQDGRTATFQVAAFSWHLCVCKTRVFGTRGDITGDGNKLHQRMAPDSMWPSGHGGGDAGVLLAFLRTIQEGVDHLRCSIDECFESHMWVFAAEEAQKKSVVVDLNDFKRKHAMT